MNPGLLFLLLIIVAVGGRLLAGRLNHHRIREYVANQGGKVLAITWEPFGIGWFGEKDSAIYEVRYRDREGNVHVAHRKTSMFSGVYFTHDGIVNRASPKPADARQPDHRGSYTALPPLAAEETPTATVDVFADNARLREENRRLREELERLRK